MVSIVRRSFEKKMRRGDNKRTYDDGRGASSVGRLDAGHECAHGEAKRHCSERLEHQNEQKVSKRVRIQSYNPIDNAPKKDTGHHVERHLHKVLGAKVAQRVVGAG